MSSGMRPFRQIRMSRNFVDYERYHPYNIQNYFPTFKD
jgi:hypothetical protein